MARIFEPALKAECYMSPADGGPRYCNGAGNMPACQLCEHSPTYWRNAESSSPPEPATDVEPHHLAHQAPPDVFDPGCPVCRPAQVFLDWSSHGPHGAAPRCNPPRPCVLCRRPSSTLSPDKGVPCHKTCAEDWLQAHPEARDKDHGPATL